MRKCTMKKICVVLSGALLFSSFISGISVSAKTSDSVSGVCGSTHVNGGSRIKKRSATAYTTQSGHTGSVKANGTCEYRDVSAGKTKTKVCSKTATISANIDFNVYEEDYMKKLTTKHSMVIPNYTWGPSSGTQTSVSYTLK